MVSLWPLSIRSLHISVVFFSDLSLGRDTHSHSVLGGIHQFSVALVLIWKVGTTFLTLLFLCAWGLNPTAPGQLGTLWEPQEGVFYVFYIFYVFCPTVHRHRGLPSPSPWPSQGNGPREEEEGPGLVCTRSTPETGAKTRGKAPCREGLEHLASVSQPLCTDQNHITSSCIWATTPKGPQVWTPSSP